MDKTRERGGQIKGIRLRNYDKGYIGNLHLEMSWSTFGFIPYPECRLTIVDNEQAQQIAKSGGRSNSFYSRLTKEDLIALRAQVDDVLKILDETESQFGTPEEVSEMREAERRLVSSVWEKIKVDADHEVPPAV